MATPNLYNAERHRVIVESVREGNFRETAAAKAGVSSVTLRNWERAGARGKEPYVQFATDLDQAEAEAESTMLSSLKAAGLADWRALAWVLERRGAKRGWAPKNQIELSGSLSVEATPEAAARLVREKFRPPSKGTDDPDGSD